MSTCQMDVGTGALILIFFQVGHYLVGKESLVHLADIDGFTTNTKQP